MIHPNEKTCLVQGKILFTAFVWVFLFLSSSLSEAVKPTQIELDYKLKSLVSHGSVLVADEKNVLYRYPTETNPPLVPASVLKLATALTALHYLGT